MKDLEQTCIDCGSWMDGEATGNDHCFGCNADFERNISLSRLRWPGEAKYEVDTMETKNNIQRLEHGQKLAILANDIYEKAQADPYSRLTLEGAYNTARRQLCEHDHQPLFNDNLRQYYRCHKCGDVKT